MCVPPPLFLRRLQARDRGRATSTANIVEINAPERPDSTVNEAQALAVDLLSDMVVQFLFGVGFKLETLSK